MLKSYFISEEEYKNCVVLWRSVILQALTDLKSNVNKEKNNLYRAKAILWINLNNENFLTVCDRADISPAVVYRCKLRIMKETNAEEKIIEHLKQNRKSKKDKTS
jgi:hypothetical protein